MTRFPHERLLRALRLERGFALVSSLLMLVLLTLLAVGMLSLAAVSTRASAIDSSKARAQTNARMALMIALGELQQYAGSDTRVTAPADILGADNPPLIGVWRSWEGSDHEQSGDLTGRPIQPDYDSKEVSQQTDESGRFLRWLVSGGSEALMPDGAASLVSRTPSMGTVPLVSKGSLAVGDDREVHVVPILTNGDGGHAWWVSGENQKAYLPKPHGAKSDDAPAWSDMGRSHAVADPSVYGLEALLSDPSPAQKVFTRNTIALLQGQSADAGAQLAFHDLSATSMGLLTNVATGGWRKDLSLLSEKWNEQPYEDLPFFRLNPQEDLLYTRPDDRVPGITGQFTPIPEEHTPMYGSFYHWSDYRTAPNNGASAQHMHRRAAAASWTSLVDHATFYRKNCVSLGAGGVPTTEMQSFNFHDSTSDLYSTFKGLHNTWAMPHLARLQLILSHYATNDYAASAPGKLRPAVLYTPVVTLWNPYNYRIQITQRPTLELSFEYAIPIALKYQGLASDYWSVQRSQNDNSYLNRYLTLTGRFKILLRAADLTLDPGETRVFSPEKGRLVDATWGADTPGLNSWNRLIDAPFTAGKGMSYRPGVRYGVGYYFGLDRLFRDDLAYYTAGRKGPFCGDGSLGEMGRQDIVNYINNNNLGPQLTLSPGFTLKADARFDHAMTNKGADECGIAYSWGFQGESHANIWGRYLKVDANELYPEMSGLASASLSEVNGNPMPFLSMVFGSRIASDSMTATKGVVQANPAVKFASSGEYEWYADNYPGMKNMLNTPFEYAFVPHSSGPGDTNLPNASNSDNSGYIVTGVTKAEGINRLISTELSTRPLASLAELTHWYLRGLNPVPPHAQDIVANSDATPLVPSDAVVDEANNAFAGLRKNEQQDDSYCANHILFDDWFFSSIAPEPQTYGATGKTLQENYSEFLTGDDPLTNRAYRPIQQDMAANSSQADQAYNDHVRPTDSWRTIASRLEVDGMFNVNSTSVKAWRALIGHARNQKIPHLTASGQTVLSEETDYAFPRTAIASQSEAGTAVTGTYFATSEFAGYRVFTDEMLDAMAESIVEQVRLRGPFLSLSEFVNRQLSNDEDLAIGGAIQVALNELQEDPSLNPFDVMEGESVPSVANPPGANDYTFPEAAVGYNTYGLPGWPRQADVLRPIAPILSARDDTFTIRAYGDARDAKGNIIARAWCEATVRRTRDYCDPSDEADITTEPTSVANRLFGRKFIITSFRWLNADEI